MRDDRRSSDVLERNLERLLSRFDPELEMPADEEVRVLRSLAGGRKTTAKRHRSRFRAVLAAAAIVSLAITALLLVPRQGAVLWADVVAHLDGITSLSSPFVIEKRTENGELEIESGHVYFKDPGKERLELASVGDSQNLDDGRGSNPKAIRIFTSGEDFSTQVLIDPQLRIGYWRKQWSKGCDEAPHSDPFRAAAIWRLLGEVREASARVVGRRLVGTDWAVGFEAVLGEVSNRAYLAVPADSVIRIWASEVSAVPLAVELEGGTYADGSDAGHILYEPLEWNPKIDDALFTLAGYQDFDIDRQESLTVCFGKTVLDLNVEVTLARVDGYPPLLTSADIISVVSGTDRWDPRDPDASLQRSILLEVTEKGFEGVRSVLGFPRYDPLLVRFDERSLRLQVGRYGDGDSRLELDITPLGLSFEEFEARYLE